MGHDGIRVDHLGLDRAADDLLATVRQLEERLQRLAQELAPLQGEWSGQAELAFVAARARWNAAIREMGDLLAETSRAVRQSNADYRDADRRGAAAFGG